MQAVALLSILNTFLKGCHPIHKAAHPAWSRLAAIAAKAEPTMRKAILRAIAQTVEGVDLAALEKALAAKNISAALKAIPWGQTGMDGVRAAYQQLVPLYESAGKEAATQLTRSGLDMSFTLSNPRAVAWADTVAATRVVQVDEATVEALRGIITRGFTEGRPPREMARWIRGPKDAETGQYRSSVIGLTDRQATAVVDYRASLESDPMRPNTAQESAKIDRMAERYRDQLVLQRATTIARTETITAANEGQLEAWMQARESGLLRGNEQRVWLADSKACEICLSIEEAGPVGFDEPFVDLNGDEYMAPTAHPNCECGMDLVIPSA